MEAPLSLVDVRKSYGRVAALRGVSFTASPGRVCGLLGANGAGKSTALRVLLGLARADSGRALVGGAPFVELDAPAGVVGAVLESVGVRPDRSGRDHLRVAARRLGVGSSRVESLLSLVGLSDAAGRATGGYSLGMRQRLAVACALLGDPAALVLDEPANGLDPPGRRWLGGLLRELAAEGRTVLLSSHVLAEVERLADDVVLLHEGLVLARGPLASLAAGAEVRTPQVGVLARAVAEAGGSAELVGEERLRVVGLSAAALGQVILRAGVEVHELQSRRRLEDVVAELIGPAPPTGSVPPEGPPARSTPHKDLPSGSTSREDPPARSTPPKDPPTGSTLRGPAA
jgi:ABC-2 type transport system ATP-binding protein